MPDTTEAPYSEVAEECQDRCVYGECSAPATMQGCGGCCGCLGPCVVTYEKSRPDVPTGADTDLDLMDLCQCQGCGEYRGMAALGMSHACHRNEDGTYEEGGTFQ